MPAKAKAKSAKPAAKKPRPYTCKMGGVYKMCVGSKAQVMHGTAYRTSGGLTKSKLMVHPKSGRIISKARHEAGKKQYAKMSAAVKAKFKANAEKNRFKPGQKRKAPASKKAAPKKASAKKAAPKKSKK